MYISPMFIIIVKYNAQCSISLPFPGLTLIPMFSVCSKDDRFPWTFVLPLILTGKHSDTMTVRCLFVSRPSGFTSAL